MFEPVSYNELKEIIDHELTKLDYSTMIEIFTLIAKGRFRLSVHGQSIPWTYTQQRKIWMYKNSKQLNLFSEN